MTLLSVSAEQSVAEATCKIPPEMSNETVYLIFDNVELTRSWSGGTLLLAALFRLSELTRLPNLGLIFISSVGLYNYQAATMAREPLQLYFRDYNDNELYQILLLQRPNVELYASFLRSMSLQDSLSLGVFVYYLEECVHMFCQNPNGCGTFKMDSCQPNRAFVDHWAPPWMFVHSIILFIN